MENPVMPKVSNMELTCIGKEYAAPIGSQAIVARRATTSGYITLERLTSISSMEAPSNGATMENSATACPINWHKITPRIKMCIRDRNEKGKKLLGMMYFMLKGLPFIYQGQELGMENCAFPSM